MVRPFRSVTSTRPLRGAAGSISPRSAMSCTLSFAASTRGSAIRSYEWLSSKETAPSTSASAMMCWQLTSGIERSLTIRAPSSGSLTTIRSTLSTLSLCSRSSLRNASRSEEHTSELQSPCNLVCRLLLEKKKKKKKKKNIEKKKKKKKRKKQSKNKK